MSINQEKIDEWVAALRSGQYEQTTGVLAALKTSTPVAEGTVGYCCLGLLCNLNGGERVSSNRGSMKWRGMYAMGLPPIEIAEQVLGIDDPRQEEDSDSNLTVWDAMPDWPEGLTERHSGKWYADSLTLASLNDSGFTFEQIADVIEHFGVQ